MDMNGFENRVLKLENSIRNGVYKQKKPHRLIFKLFHILKWCEIISASILCFIQVLNCLKFGLETVQLCGAKRMLQLLSAQGNSTGRKDLSLLFHTENASCVQPENPADLWEWNAKWLSSCVVHSKAQSSHQPKTKGWKVPEELTSSSKPLSCAGWQKKSLWVSSASGFQAVGMTLLVIES